jgi:hypothetical protein
MRPVSWWASRVRQFRAHLAARVAPDERVALATGLTPAQLELFDAMPVADRRHGLDVAACLRAQGVSDPDVILAGLLHDAAKGPGVGLWPRVAWSLGEAWGPWVVSVAGLLPGFRLALERLRDHAAPRDNEYGELLRLADEAN